jgi:hypothetical protein
VPGFQGLGLAGLGQPLGPLGAQALQHREPGRLPTHRHHKGPVHQPEEAVQDLADPAATHPSAAATVQPPENTDSRRHNRRSCSSSSSQLQSTVARRVCWRGSRVRPPPASSRNRSPSRPAISATGNLRTRAAANSMASGRPSRRRHSSATTSTLAASRLKPGSAVAARSLNSRTAS